MSDSRPSPRDAAADSVSIDVSAMPRVLRRIMGLALRYPGLVALAVGCSIGAALFSLTLPRLFGQAVDQAHLLLARQPAGPAYGLWGLCGRKGQPEGGL
jgi:ATP-binding cassette, subfamily B, multidrug efflux pump